MFSKFTASKLSAYFSRRMSNESTGSLSENELSDGDVGADDSPSAYLSYFRRLKETTDKLHLSARRPSIMLWRQQYLESQNFPRGKSNMNSDITDGSLTLDRKHRIDRALEWLKIQLVGILIYLCHILSQLKLQRSTEEHQELIDDFHFELQELQEFSDILDLPIPEHGSNPLKHIGITRLNISARRFSAC
ncbi:unnamed protein product [Candidula unifasciata]|uniref:Uncharacterized protein n=1 Tax=Candidula unifasciata TaxID=100452 RepID=A0A8S3Z2A4_9EUPU|nr:unnamed protein product [Candidula unifasciata]